MPCWHRGQSPRPETRLTLTAPTRQGRGGQVTAAPTGAPADPGLGSLHAPLLGLGVDVVDILLARPAASRTCRDERRSAGQLDGHADLAGNAAERIRRAATCGQSAPTGTASSTREPTLAESGTDTVTCSRSVSSRRSPPAGQASTAQRQQSLGGLVPTLVPGSRSPWLPHATGSKSVPSTGPSTRTMPAP